MAVRPARARLNSVALSIATSCPFCLIGLPSSSTFTCGWSNSASISFAGSKKIDAPESSLSLIRGLNCPGARPELRRFISLNILAVSGSRLTPSESRIPLPVTQEPFASIMPPLLKCRSLSTGILGRTVSRIDDIFLFTAPLADTAPSLPLSAISAYWSACFSIKYSTAIFSSG